MTIKLNKVYSASSLHEGVWKKIKGAWDSESNAKPLPERPPEPKHPQPAHVERKTPMPPKKLTPNLGQKPSEDGGPDYTKTMLAGIVGGVVAGPIGAGVGIGYGLKKFRKKT